MPKNGCSRSAKIRQNCVRKSLHILVSGDQPVQKMQFMCKLVPHVHAHEYILLNFRML